MLDVATGGYPYTRLRQLPITRRGHSSPEAEAAFSHPRFSGLRQRTRDTGEQRGRCAMADAAQIAAQIAFGGTRHRRHRAGHDRVTVSRSHCSGSAILLGKNSEFASGYRFRQLTFGRAARHLGLATRRRRGSGEACSAESRRCRPRHRIARRLPAPTPTACTGWRRAASCRARDTPADAGHDFSSHKTSRGCGADTRLRPVGMQNSRPNPCRE